MLFCIKMAWIVIYLLLGTLYHFCAIVERRDYLSCSRAWFDHCDCCAAPWKWFANCREIFQCKILIVCCLFAQSLHPMQGKFCQCWQSLSPDHQQKFCHIALEQIQVWWDLLTSYQTNTSNFCRCSIGSNPLPDDLFLSHKYTMQ